MSTTTTRNSLVKPGYADAADIAVINTNYDTIDASFAKCNWAAAVAPAVTDDSGDGYSIGSVWFDTTNNNIYVAKSVSVGAAVWTKQAAHNNYGATAAPAVTDDISKHYAPGSIWVDTTNHNVYICETAGVGTALWKQVNTAAITGYVKQDGSLPLTADWDVGAYTVTAKTLTSDVAVGTAPFTATSTTVCTNVNADLLDSREGAAYAVLAGQAGGQTLYGSTGASENLVFYSTSNATKGAIYMPEGGLVLGTKATTAAYDAINIHEGAAGAANAINFIDGDGSTTVGALWKTSADSMVLSAGDGTTESLKVSSAGALTMAAGITATTGNIATGSGYFSGGKTAEDTSGTFGLALTSRPTFSKDQTTTAYNIYSAVFPECDTGKTNSGNVYSFYTECMRNHNGAATDDGGTIAGMYAQQAFVGHYNLHADEPPLTTYCSGVRVSPYYVTGTISNLYAIEVSAPSTGGTVTNGWSMYNAYSGNTYWAATYNRFQSTTGDRIIYCVQTSTTDPIADAWNTHSNEKYKNDLGPIDSDIDRSARYQARKAIADRTLHTWTRKVELDREHYEGMFPLEDDRMRGLPGEEIPPKDLEVRLAEQDLAIYRHTEKCKTLKKFQKKNYGMFAEETPEEITSYGLDGQPEGIDLGAYIGWVHRAVDAMQYDLDFLEVDVADIDSILWLMDSDMYFINEALIVAEEKIKILADKNTELESKNDALLRKHEDYERRMALLEQRLAKLEKQ